MNTLKLSVLLLVIGGASSLTANEKQPNIVIYMVDDLGWNHVNATAGTMDTAKDYSDTPNIAMLARRGLSFTHAYAQPNCAPTRAAMLTGQYPARVHNNVYVVQHLNRFGRGGITKEKARFLGPPQSEDVAVEAITVAEALQKNGYATAHIGKYHCGGHIGEETLPENAGFDINIGGCQQGHQPTCFSSKKNGTWGFKGLGRGDFDRFAAPYDQAYLDKHELPASLLGTPKHVCDALGDAVEETIEKLAGGDKPFYLQFHTYAVHGPVKARPDIKEATAKRLKKSQQGRLVEYAAFISSVDNNLKRLLDAIDDPNGDGDHSDSETANTLILFTSDNGGTHADNLPLRGNKGMFTEGGVRVPLIAYWPGVIEPGTVSNRVVHSLDFYPTYLQLAGEKWVPSTKTHPLDGDSFAGVLKNPKDEEDRKTLHYLFPGYMDTRAEPTVVTIERIEGKQYKLYYFYETGARELYCVTDDIGEAKDLAASKPKLVAELAQTADAWLRQQHPTWQPAYPISKETGKPVGPPPLPRVK